MNQVQTAINSAIAEVDRLRQTLRRNNAKQVKLAEERAIAKSTALSWFNTHRQVISASLGDENLPEIDQLCNLILRCTC